MSKTEKNLKDAFAGESQANRKYLAFAQKAQTEGYPQVAKLFRAAAEAETVHAHTHLRTPQRGQEHPGEPQGSPGRRKPTSSSPCTPHDRRGQGRGQRGRRAHLHLCQRGGESARRALPEGDRQPGQSRRRTWTTTSARCAATPSRRRPRRSARSARPRRRPS
ncbi:MAG: rubrerythrin family protein [Desulfosudis oleivorans]|nr:rubrerythrin family protein [Desulfosudis oleivorans]